MSGRSMRFRMALQKGLTVLAVAKTFSAPGAGRGESGSHIAVFKAVLKARSVNEFVQESRVETVAGPDSINRLNGKRSGPKSLVSAFGQHALRATLDDDNGNETGQGVERASNIAGACNPAGLVLVRQKHIDVFSTSSTSLAQRSSGSSLVS